MPIDPGHKYGMLALPSVVTARDLRAQFNLRDGLRAFTELPSWRLWQGTAWLGCFATGNFARGLHAGARIEAFWSLGEAKRKDLWGEAFHVEAVEDSFREETISTDENA